MQPVLEMKAITKRFPGVIANNKVDLTLYPGEIHALLGENGAGKSTLMNVLTGIYASNEGTIFLNGKEVCIDRPKAAVDLGIGMVHQHFKLVDTLSVAKNIYLASGKSRFFLSEREMERIVRERSEEYNLSVDPKALVWQLSVGEQQRVEIVKLLFCGAELLILDEPTAVLTPQEAAALFKTLRKMAQAGKSILFITHKLFEVMTYADRITVLRNGKSVGTMRVEETSQQELIRLMVGRDVMGVTYERTKPEEPAPVLTLHGVHAYGDKNTMALNGINLCVYKGEILGIAGVAGNGQRELCEVIVGLKKAAGGSVVLNDEDVTNRSAKYILDKGVAFVPEDRMGMGLVASLNMMDNAILRDCGSPKNSRRGMLRKKEILAGTQEMVTRHEIKNSGLFRPISLMSGGNLQKLLLAREISGNPRVIVAAYPVHGVDVGATEAIHRILLKQRAEGTAILLISEDLEELYALSDRVGVLFEGRIVDTVDIADFTYEGIGKLMVGIGGGQARVEKGVPGVES
ncbi:MAG: ABC transporter ATP-binding protein [Bacillota bacterium]